MASKQEILHNLIEPVVASLGCELWGLEYLTQGRYTTLRIFIDGPSGVSLEDCEKVSRQISAVMDVEDPIDGEYTLEVSSPGMDRSLYTASHYARYVGETVNVRLRMARDGRRRFKGNIVKVENEDVTINVEGKEILIPVDAIDKANIFKANILPRYDEIISKIDELKEKNKSEEK
jgi:ribosome maturation factor RimP